MNTSKSATVHIQNNGWIWKHRKNRYPREPEWEEDRVSHSPNCQFWRWGRIWLICRMHVRECLVSSRSVSPRSPHLSQRPDPNVGKPKKLARSQSHPAPAQPPSHPIPARPQSHPTYVVPSSSAIRIIYITIRPLTQPWPTARPQAWPIVKPSPLIKSTAITQ